MDTFMLKDLKANPENDMMCSIIIIPQKTINVGIVFLILHLFLSMMPKGSKSRSAITTVAFAFIVSKGSCYCN